VPDSSHETDPLILSKKKYSPVWCVCVIRKERERVLMSLDRKLPFSNKFVPCSSIGSYRVYTPLGNGSILYLSP